ncbi:uncharacterized protein [Onthophagus taurus]|uniref:uncharacterized protein n=1 Tax=Onthophagus taurus TaxID=166361 RepID=UPI0039BE1705
MVPFVIYADFESTLQPIDFCEPNSSKSFTEKVEMHQPYSFAYYIVSTIDSSFNKFETYTGLDTSHVFITKLIDDVKFIYNKYLKTVKPMIPLRTDEQRNFDSAENCYICQNPFTSDQIKHLFNNKEKYIGFSKRVFVDKLINEDKIVENIFLKLRFVDSFRFMVSSLDTLAGNLEINDFINIRKFFPHPEHFKLLTKKGIFPYNYITSFDKLNDTSLPPKSMFYNKLNLEDISDEQYSHAQCVWKEFNCQNLKQYSDLYLKTDVLLLTDVFEKFRQVCFKTYDLDPAHCYTAPGLFWDAMLKFTKIKLELLTDIDQVHFIKKGIRGGISQCFLRNLKQAVAHGLKVSKINRVLSFRQSTWLKSYIDKNTALRQSANNSFEKDFFKLMNNAVFGKTMENVDKRVDVRLVTSWDDVHTSEISGRPRLGARSLIAKLNFKSISIFTETFSAIQMDRLHVVYDKPLYVGFTVLELSKLLMYNFYYDFLKPKYGESIRLCYMDTDSFTVLIDSDDVYRDVKLNLDKFDTSNYSSDNQFDIALHNKAVLDKMKDDNCGNIMVEFIGLRSKVYANRVADGRVTKKSKGVKKAIVKQHIFSKLFRLFKFKIGFI